MDAETRRGWRLRRGRPAASAGPILGSSPRLKRQWLDPVSYTHLDVYKRQHLKQAEAAEILMVSRPRVSDVVNKKTAKFTIDTLVEMLSRVGKPVKLAIG